MLTAWFYEARWGKFALGRVVTEQLLVNIICCTHPGSGIKSHLYNLDFENAHWYRSVVLCRALRYLVNISLLADSTWWQKTIWWWQSKIVSVGVVVAYQFVPFMDENSIQMFDKHMDINFYLCMLAIIFMIKCKEGLSLLKNSSTFHFVFTRPAP